MPRQLGWHTAGLVMAIVGGPSTVTAEGAGTIQISIHVVADGRIRSEVVEEAKPVATRIYRQIGIELVFVDEATADGITMRVVNRPMKEAGASAMGVAPRGGDQIGRLLFAFYGRIEAYARQHDKPVSHILAHVMAHELGHLLLPHGSHSKSGLMVAAWDRKQVEHIGRGWLSFTPDQAEAIRSRARLLVPQP
jgi:hypothetical protein